MRSHNIRALPKHVLLEQQEPDPIQHPKKSVDPDSQNASATTGGKAASCPWRRPAKRIACRYSLQLTIL